ncbi:MAG: Phosphoribosylglycinamide formyltransferase (EC [uncultured Thiotrichaceae bacterium]|uniref:Phosphoribosylglycinamide formyltransferase n=1 Tax=uncultured Thiotrichaceae bacterium TaxID=298394 RepID=A0A6S6TE99_9GAMM|nr:MAG: Phosphoribosylglycinamide formyltransferase (EC [uncultured Thiotrichaceae bacterium]
MASPMSIVVLISGSGSNLQAIIDSISAGQVYAKIRAVISNVPDAYGLERAKSARIPTEVINHEDYEDRKSFDTVLASTIDSYSPDLVVLAGFMRLLSENFVNHYSGRMLNIHPSLLPKYPGLNTYQRAIEAGDTEHGASVHFVTPEMDSGPIVLQGVLNIAADESVEKLAKRVLHEEHAIYPLAISWFVDNRLTFENDQAFLDGKLMKKPAIYREGSLIMPELQN